MSATKLRRCESYRADDLAGNFAKEAFHQIEPGGRGGNEMDVETGMTLKPSGDFGVLVRGIVVANDVKLQVGGDLLIDLAQINTIPEHRGVLMDTCAERRHPSLD